MYAINIRATLGVRDILNTRMDASTPQNAITATAQAIKALENEPWNIGADYSRTLRIEVSVTDIR